MAFAVTESRTDRDWQEALAVRGLLLAFSESDVE